MGGLSGTMIDVGGRMSLRGKLGFSGLIMTAALAPAGVSRADGPVDFHGIGRCIQELTRPDRLPAPGFTRIDAAKVCVEGTPVAAARTCLTSLTNPPTGPRMDLAGAVDACAGGSTASGARSCIDVLHAAGDPYVRNQTLSSCGGGGEGARAVECIRSVNELRNRVGAREDSLSIGYACAGGNRGEQARTCLTRLAEFQGALPFATRARACAGGASGSQVHNCIMELIDGDPVPGLNREAAAIACAGGRVPAEARQCLQAMTSAHAVLRLQLATAVWACRKVRNEAMESVLAVGTGQVPGAAPPSRSSDRSVSARPDTAPVLSLPAPVPTGTPAAAPGHE